MAFTLNKVIDGAEKLFLLQKILEVLGDPINDEISLDGDAYRISSYVSLSSGEGSGQIYLWYALRLSITEIDQVSIVLPELITDTSSISLYINGIHYSYGRDESYHINEYSLLWHGDFSLEASDHILLKYRKAI